GAPAGKVRSEIASLAELQRLLVHSNPGRQMMPRLAPLPREAAADLEDVLERSEGRMGFVPNSQLIMARRPEILRAFAQLVARSLRRRDLVQRHELIFRRPQRPARRGTVRRPR